MSPGGGRTARCVHGCQRRRPSLTGLRQGACLYDGTVSRNASTPRWRPQPPLRTRALLVLTVLVGLLGMHGLAPAAALPAPDHGTQHAHPMQPLEAAPAYLCDPGQSSTGGPGHHADQVCASAAIPGTAALPALAPSLSSDVITATAQPIASSYQPSGGRAPPSLAELQLLRI